MSSERSEPRAGTGTDRGADDATGTVQLLVADAGNRTAIRKMLGEQFDVKAGQTVQDADLYLVEDHLFAEYQDALRERVEGAHPTFCPVVLLRRETTELAHPAGDGSFHGGPMLLDDVVDAPIDRSLLIRRLHSLLVRRRQSQELSSHVSTLEERERKLRRFERAVEENGTATVITDSDGVIEYANSEFEEMAGYAEADVLGRSLETFLADESLGALNESFWQTMAETGEWEGELLLERKDDQRRITDTTISPIRDDNGGNEGFVVVMPDITQRIEREQLLQDREGELDLLRQILSRYLRHNLRNKLNVILGYAEMLEAKLPEEDAEDAAKIVETTNHLMDTSEKARKYSNLTEQETDLARHDVSEIVEGIVSESRERYPDVSFEADIAEDCQLLARDGIREAIDNLIDNAARHNDADDPWVRVTVTDHGGAQVVIEDNGPGICELELSTLERGNETPLRHSQGIGLWLSKWVIEGIDGRLSFDTTDGGGTRVTIDFPQADQAGTRGVAVSDLKAREQRLRTITRRMTDAVVEVDASWEISFVDERAEEILAVDADAVQARNFWDVFPGLPGTRLEEVYRGVMRSRSAASVEEYYEPIDGWLDIYAYPDFDGGISFYFRDTTDRKAREQELEQARSRMELALAVTDAAVWEWNLETDAVTVHPERHPVFDAKLRTVDELVDAIHPDDRSRVQAALDAAVETGSAYDVEYRVQTDGSVRWAADYGEVRPGDDEHGGRLVGVARDITAEKRREGELEQKRELLARTERIAGVGGWELDVETMDVFWSESLFEIMGVESDAEPPLDEALDVYHEDDRDIVEDAVDAALDSGESFDVEARFRRPSGEVRWAQIQGVPTASDGEVVRLRGAVQDITDRKERERERIRFKRAIDEAPVGITLSDPARDDNPLIYANDRFEELTGYTEDEIIGRNCRLLQGEATDPEPVARIRDAVDRRERVSVELRNYRKGGTEFWNEVSIAPVRDDDGSLLNYVGFQRDVSDQRRREGVLREMYEIISDRDRSFEEQVQALLDLGRAELDTEHGTLSEIRGDDYVFEVVASDDDSIRSGDVVPLSTTNCERVASTEKTVVLGDIERDAPEQTDRAGFTDWGISCYLGAPVYVDDDVYGTLCFYDTESRSGQFSEWEVTLVDLMSRWASYELQRRQANERLQRTNGQLEQFSSVVSHDLRNPLSVAEGRLELARAECDSDHLAPIGRALDRMDDLIADLLALAREGKGATEMTLVPLATLSESCWKNVDTADATLVTDVSRTIRADDGRLRQLFENLIRNSVEHGDDVTVTVGELDGGFSVEDDGPGIPPDRRDDVFDAGYSTREDGTGLGLRIVGQIADAHDWAIRVTEGTDGGARFEITGVEFGSE